ncbi:DNA topoisomerase [Microbotryomycetes sp. JL201]|nr:DNA topoisomerase [Microbotryomycetes sp. JL201]
MVKYLCVAEKPSIATAITDILSGGQFRTRLFPNGPNRSRNYDFSYRMPPTNMLSEFTVTAVAGHLTSNDFESQYRKWHSCDPFELFEARIKQFTTPDPRYKAMEANLSAEARRATHLMIWTDCDREGEHIGDEIAKVCQKANPRIIVKRARFNAIISHQINNACRNPVDLDRRQVDAVDARIELDLRLGAAFTREQTLKLQSRFQNMLQTFVSYGPCQFPTLGFVVEQYKRVQGFVPEAFWSIHAAIERDGSSTPFTWRRGRVYDRLVCEALLQMCQDEAEAVVLSQQTRPTSKWKPLPLTTVELQQTGSRLLRLSPKTILDLAEGLYQKGFLSYPRTETNQFDRDFNFMELIDKQKTDGAWGGFATNLANGGFEVPRSGSRNDKAHPPIHPTAHANNLAGDQKRVYELVTRRFLACCSKNAVGRQTTVEIEIAGEHFSAQGLVVLQRNYLDVYTYDKWNGNILPDFQRGERFELDILEMKEGQTSRPNLLTEADLVALMDKNEIGTDATIAEHIQKIIDREYVMKQREGNVEYLVPSTLGVGLVEGYNAIGFERSLCKPDMRRLTEYRMTQICTGLKSKQQFLHESIEEWKDIFMRTRAGFQHVIQAVARYLEGDGDDDHDEGRRGAGRDGGGARRSDDDDSDDGYDGPAPGNVGRGRSTRGRGAAARGTKAGSTGVRGTGTKSQKTPRTTGSNKRTKTEGDDDEDAGDTPKCTCGEPAVERTVTATDKGNQGKIFYACSKGRDAGCGFFEWKDQAASKRAETKLARPAQKRIRHPTPPLSTGLRTNNDDAESLRCNCDLTPVRMTTNKPGPNQGREFLRCPNSSVDSRCKFFKWLDEIQSQPVAGTSRAGPFTDAGSEGGMSAPSGTCFKCQQEGHWASNCTNQPAASRIDSPARGGARPGSCYKCEQEGHWAANCPNQLGNSGSSRYNASTGPGSAQQSGECFICPGHWASACPQRGSGTTGNRGGGGGTSNYSCFKCGERELCPVVLGKV